MKLLVDTHALLWFVSGDARLSKNARAMIEDEGTVNHISIASWWEIAIKCSLQRLELDDSLETFISRRVDEGFRALPVETEHLPTLVNLPFRHRDPFGRMIVCQAMHEDMSICTADESFSAYDVRLIW